MTIITKYKWKCYNILHLKLYASKQGLVELSEAGRRGSPGAGGAHGTPRLCPGDHDACKHRRSSAADARSWLLKCGRLLCYMTPQATSMSASARTALYCSPWAVRSLVQKFCTAPAACTHPVPNFAAEMSRDRWTLSQPSGKIQQLNDYWSRKLCTDQNISQFHTRIDTCSEVHLISPLAPSLPCSNEAEKNTEWQRAFMDSKMLGRDPIYSYLPQNLLLMFLTEKDHIEICLVTDRWCCAASAWIASISLNPEASWRAPS